MIPVYRFELLVAWPHQNPTDDLVLSQILRVFECGKSSLISFQVVETNFTLHDVGVKLSIPRQYRHSLDAQVVGRLSNEFQVVLVALYIDLLFLARPASFTFCPPGFGKLTILEDCHDAGYWCYCLVSEC